MINPASTRTARRRRNVEAGMPCARNVSLSLDGKTIRSSSPVRAVSGWKVKSAFNTESERSDTPRRGRAVHMAWKIFHLCTTFSGGRAVAPIWLATWARVSDRRPKGVGGECDCMSLPHRGKGNWFAKTTPSLTRHLTAIRGSDSLSVAKLDKRGLPDGNVWGPFSFAAMDPFSYCG